MENSTHRTRGVFPHHRAIWHKNLHVRVLTGMLDGLIIPAWYNGNSMTQQLTT